MKTDATLLIMITVIVITISSLFAVILISTNGWIAQTVGFFAVMLILTQLFTTLHKQRLFYFKEMSKINQSIHLINDLDVIHKEIHNNPYLQMFWINALFKSMKTYICDYLNQNKLKYSDFNETTLYKIFELNKEKLINKIFKLDK